MPRKPIRSRKTPRPALGERLRLYLETGDYLGRTLPPDSPGKCETFMLAYPSAEGRERLRQVWLLHRAEILRQWTAEKREGRPWAATEFSTKENER